MSEIEIIPYDNEFLELLKKGKDKKHYDSYYGIDWW